MLIKLKDQNNVEISSGSTGVDLAKHLNLSEPHQALGIEINGKLCDLSTTLTDGDVVKLINFEDPQGQEMFWHTSAHVLAQAIMHLYPNAKPTIGPPIENGFYYDFANLQISEQDLELIEKEMQSIVSQNLRTQREVLNGREDALINFKDNKYKCELIQGFEDQTFTAYRQGDFFDLCRGPHIPNLGKIKALKLTKTSGAYWRADQKNEMLTRIYGISFPDRKLLKDYLTRLEEAKKRDHKVIGPRLDLFSLREEAPGMPFIHPKGMIIWNKLLDFWREYHQKAGYVEIKTPVMMTRSLWETSGHWHNYRENMYEVAIEQREYAIKPMNCPGCMLFYKTHVHSYRELPLRVAEVGLVHRHEASGAISGLFRVRCFHQDDAHLFLKPEDITPEIVKTLDLVNQIYSVFGLTYHVELSTRPEKNTIGSDADWEMATDGLRNALIESKTPYKLNEGDGAFYGPKIDFHIKDAIGRTWQCGTIQLDFALPEKFELEYVAADGTRPRPVMLHRAIFGSIERFFGILIEHFVGRFPLWLSPIQVRIITVADRHTEYAQSILKMLIDAGIRADIDDASESVSKKIRAAQMAQINYMFTVGDKEVEDKSVTLRTRDNVVHGEIDLARFIQTIIIENNERALSSTYT
ncbi:MAG: threonine--tRNA ligase [Parachlamydiales bacterium]|nr:threonine--tRNA ligase [Parachlamydiales bacterium]